MQASTTTNNTITFELNNILYTTEFSDYFTSSSSFSLSISDDDEARVPSTPPQACRSPIRVSDLISPTSPGRNIDMIVVRKTKKTNVENRRTLLQRFQSISRRRKMDMNSDSNEEPLPETLPLEITSVPTKPKSITTPWEIYSKQNYFRGVFSA